MGKTNRVVTVGGNKATVALDTDATLAGNSDSAIATQKATKAYIDGLATAGVDTDATFAADSDILVPSQKAVKTALESAPIAPTKPIEAANAVAVVRNCSAVLSTTGTTVLDLTDVADGDEFNLISSAAQNISIDFGVGVSVYAAGVAGTGARYVKFTNVVGTSCKAVRLSATSYYLTSYVGAVTIAAAP